MLKSDDEAIALAKAAERLRARGLGWQSIENRLGASRKTIKKYHKAYIDGGEDGVYKITDQSRHGLGSGKRGKKLSRSLSIQESIDLGREAYNLKQQGFNFYQIYKKLGKRPDTIRRWLGLYEEGGEQAIKDRHEQNKQKNKKANAPKDAISKFWREDFKYTNLWNLAIYGKQ